MLTAFFLVLHSLSHAWDVTFSDQIEASVGAFGAVQLASSFLLTHCAASLWSLHIFSRDHALAYLQRSEEILSGQLTFEYEVSILGGARDLGRQSSGRLYFVRWCLIVEILYTLCSFRPSGAWDFEVAPGFVRKFCTMVSNCGNFVYSMFFSPFWCLGYWGVPWSFWKICAQLYHLD